MSLECIRYTYPQWKELMKGNVVMGLMVDIATCPRCVIRRDAKYSAMGGFSDTQAGFR